MVFARAFLPEIQGVILSHLSTPDLKNCALVAPSWNREASRLLWHSIRFEVLITYHRDIAPVSEKFARFINDLILEARRVPYVRRLVLVLGSFLHHPESRSIIETAEAGLTVPWDLITSALKPMRQLQYLELRGSILSRQFVSTICQALSTAPVRAVHSFVSTPRALDHYVSWASTLKDLLLQGMVDPTELPHLPHLRFIACNKLDMMAKFMLSSPLESICFYGAGSSESELAGVVDAIRAQASSGISTLRSVCLYHFLNEAITLREFMSSLESPTLEHIHLVLDGMDTSESFDLADYIAVCLEAASPSISQTLPSLRSLRFEVYDQLLEVVPSKHLRPEHVPSDLVTEAGFYLSTWLQQGHHPPLLQRIELYSMGAVPDTPSESAYRIVNIESTRSPAVPGQLLESSDLWEVTDSIEDVALQQGAFIRPIGIDHPLLRLSDRATLPVVPDSDGVIRYARAVSLNVINDNGPQISFIPA